jgi:hypothetical protein
MAVGTTELSAGLGADDEVGGVPLLMQASLAARAGAQSKKMVMGRSMAFLSLTCPEQRL